MEPLCLVHDRFDWMRASVDGIDFDRAIVLEIKCPLRSEDHRLAIEGRVPRHYFAQLQHQLEVTAASDLHYWSFDGERGVLVRVGRDSGYIERLIEAEAEFWQRVLENRWPELSEDELDLSDDSEWLRTALRYREIKLRLEQVTCDERRARAQLEAMATARRTYGGGIEVVRSFRKGAVDYATVPQLRGVDLEPYRKPSVEVVKINLGGQP